MRPSTRKSEREKERGGWGGGGGREIDAGNETVLFS